MVNKDCHMLKFLNLNLSSALLCITLRRWKRENFEANFETTYC